MINSQYSRLKPVACWCWPDGCVYEPQPLTRGGHCAVTQMREHGKIVPWLCQLFQNKTGTICEKTAERVKFEDLIVPSSELVLVPPPMSQLTPIDRDELTDIVRKSPNKTCSLDILPTTLLKLTLDIRIMTLVNIINTSLASDSFPQQLKVPAFKPLSRSLS